MFTGIIVCIVLISALMSRLSHNDIVFYVGLGLAGALVFVWELSFGRAI